MDGVRIDVFSSKRTEHCRVRLCSVGVASLRRAALQCEVAVCRVYECILAQAVEGILEAIHRTDVWVPVRPTCQERRITPAVVRRSHSVEKFAVICELTTPLLRLHVVLIVKFRIARVVQESLATAPVLGSDERAGP
ncbi:hypothetical protein NP493_816g01028 [Ridgeia piscesae]|uniref:Uncharacterized protein n=1 Tax=Ridgeia piscesae TaxID=27915 RepID=A0AAD9KMY5_RIDPI|nr:hypothetical protein NP493_816g01028 [Ridgeia piscesae]